MAFQQTLLEALEDRFEDEDFATAFRSLLKKRTRRAEESLQYFAMAVKPLAHRDYTTLIEDHIRREVRKAFADGVEDHETKVVLLIGGRKR
jgi:hypothetical protein